MLLLLGLCKVRDRDHFPPLKFNLTRNMSTQFESFTSLSAELRATIWRLALRQELGTENGTGRQIEFNHYHPESESISIAISCRYPTLFAVCCEARYESAKAMNCTWIPVYARYNSLTEPNQTTRFEICINFKLDTITLRDRFMAPLSQGPLVVRPTREQHQLETLACLLDYQIMKRIECVGIDAQPPPASRRLDFDAWRKGEGLEIFCPGRLRRVSIITRTRSESSSKDYSRWLEAAVKDEIHDRWAERGQVDEPRVEVLNV